MPQLLFNIFIIGTIERYPVFFCPGAETHTSKYFKKMYIFHYFLAFVTFVRAKITIIILRRPRKQPSAGRILLYECNSAAHYTDR